jgi:pyruvate/2-oxoglutarate dehydrogenase complex dihydrolipoamide dehydrogenase (E3) component
LHWMRADMFASTDRLETTAPNVWAMGDGAGSPQFTHVAGDDFHIVRDNLAGGTRSTRDRLVPYCMFTDPQLAHVGLSERDAQTNRIPVRVAKLPMSAVLRTEATDETQGFMKAIVAQDNDRILGFTMVGAEAGKSWPRCRPRSWRNSRIRHCATPFWRTRPWPRDWDPCWKMFNRLLQPKWNNRLLQLHS